MTVIHHFPQALIDADACRFFIGRRHLGSTNPFTRHVRVEGPLDERWIAEVTFNTQSLAEADEYEGFLDRIDGKAGFFTFHDPKRPYPLGAAAGGNPFNGGVTHTAFDDGTTFDDGKRFIEGAGFGYVGAAGVAGSEWLTISGLVASQTVSLKTGDRFSVMIPGQAYGYLHKVVASAPSDANGDATVKIRPRLRRDVWIGQIVQFNYAKGVFQLQGDDDAHATSWRHPGLGASGFKLVEAPEVIEL